MPEVTCDNCGKFIEDLAAAHQWCSEECMKEWEAKNGKRMEMEGV